MEWKKQLYQLLSERFNRTDLKSLCFYLDIDWDDLEGTQKSEKIQSLISHIYQYDMLEQLQKNGQELRPDIDWSQFSSSFCKKMTMKVTNQRPKQLDTQSIVIVVIIAFLSLIISIVALVQIQNRNIMSEIEPNEIVPESANAPEPEKAETVLKPETW